MKKLLVIVFVGLLVATPAAAQTAPKVTAGGVTLESVLNQMDATAKVFKSAQANFEWDQYEKVVDETDKQQGVIYFRRSGNKKDVEMAADIQSPAKKYLVYSAGKAQLYQPNINQVTPYDTGKNKAGIEVILMLGFGGRGHDLQKTFDVAWGGTETVGGISTGRLDLTPKGENARGMFSKVVLWVDLARGVSVQQKAFEPSGNYRVCHYDDIKINQPLADDIFNMKTKTNNKTTHLNP